MATFYHWQDAGGPARSMTGSYFEKFKQLLVACLVTGYSGRAAAGWELFHEYGTTGFSLRNANGRIVNFVDAGGTTYYGSTKVYLIEGPISTSAALLTADLVRSGQGAPSSNTQMINLAVPFSTGYSSLSWTVVADDKTFIFYGMGYAWNFNDSLPHTLFYCGEDSAGNFLAFGGTNTTSATSVQGRFHDGGFTYLRDPLTGLTISTEPGRTMLGLANGAGRVAYTDQVGELNLSPIMVATGTTVFSKLRGMAVDFGLQAFDWPTLLAAIGQPASVEGRGRPALINGIEVALVNASISYAPIPFLTTDPDFW